MHIAVATLNGQDEILLEIPVMEKLFKGERVVFEGDSGIEAGTLLFDSVKVADEMVREYIARYGYRLPLKKVLGKYELKKFEPNTKNLGLFINNAFFGTLGARTSLIDSRGSICSVGDIIRLDGGSDYKRNGMVVCNGGKNAVMVLKPVAFGDFTGEIIYDCKQESFIRVLDWTSLKSGDTYRSLRIVEI